MTVQNLRPWLSRIFRRFSPVHRERDLLVASLATQLAEDPVFEIPAFRGNFQIDRRSRLFYRLVVAGEYEPELSKLVLKYVDPSRDAIDVGANVGFFSCLLAKLVVGRRVLSVEPTRGALKHLVRNLQRNGVESQVTVFEGVVSDRSGTVGLCFMEGKEEFSSVGEITHPSADASQIQRVDVKSATLDELVANLDLAPGFIKVDTEGAEALVFQGAQNVLQQFRPVVLSELSDPLLRAKGSSASEVIELFRRLDYDVTDPLAPGRPVGARLYGDLLAVPR